MRLKLIVPLLLWVPTVLLAQQVPAEPLANAESAQLLEAMVVSGVQPGPGLWRVSKDDHVMWVLGTLAPLPKRMRWEAQQVQQMIAESQEVLLAPTGRLKADVGFFGGLALLPAALGARKNPDKQKLVDLLPAELYARWLLLKRQYLGRGNGIEKRRPLLASNKLFEAALRRSGLSEKDVVERVVRRAANKAKVTITQPEIEIVIADPKQALKDFSRTQLDDVACFAQTLERVENDLPMMRDRANAWATGDMETLAELPYVDQDRACADALLNASIMRERGLDDLRERLAAVWLGAAESALSTHKTSFAVLPMGQITLPDGYLATLRERGYTVEAPL